MLAREYVWVTVTVLSEKAVQVGASRLWWKRFVEKISFEPGMKQ